MIATASTRVEVLSFSCNACALADLFSRFGDQVSLEDGRYTNGVRVYVSGDLVLWLNGGLPRGCTCTRRRELVQ